MFCCRSGEQLNSVQHERHSDSDDVFAGASADGVLLNKSFTSDMTAKCKQFWFNYVLPEIRTHRLLKDNNEMAVWLIIGLV